jgi:hydrogenase nickel incorporation protein HypA/HybF
MHEMSIATQLLETVLAVAAENGAAGVEQVEVELGAMRLVVPEVLELAWQVAAEGTLAEGARLKMTDVPIQAKCRDCGRAFAAEIGNFLCPGCGQADVEIVAGDDIILKTVVCRDEEGASRP